MRGNNIIVMCMASGMAMSPFCAYHCRPPGMLLDTEAWLASALRGEDAFEAFQFALIWCMVVGLLIGLLVKQCNQGPEKTGDFKVHLLRTPIAATLLAPVGVATIEFLAYNHSPRAVDDVVWPEWCMNHPMICVVLIGLPCAMATGLLNEWERAFEKAPLWRRAGILLASPLAVVVGIILMAGMIGYGLMIGASIGGNHGCPITGAWTGACIAIIILSVEGGVFWPLHFPLTRCAND